MNKEDYIDPIDQVNLEGTNILSFDTSPNYDTGTIALDNSISFMQSNQTISNKGIKVDSEVGITSVEEKPINFNKPWRQVIKRRVVDGGNNNES